MAWLRAALIAAATLAASRHDLAAAPRDVVQEGTCGAGGVLDSCSAIDRVVAPLHVTLPLAGSAGFVLFTHAPSLFLKSRNRIRELWGAVWQVACILAALLAASGLYLRFSKSWAYAFSAHFAVLYLSQGQCPTLLFAPAAYRACQALSISALLLYAWHYGPPLTVWDAPGIPACCGAVAHMAAWVAAESLGRAAVAGEAWWRLGGL